MNGHSTQRQRSTSLDDLLQPTFIGLKNELVTTKKELIEKETECKRLTGLREQMNSELEDLTASLFEEANKMIQDAHVKRIQAEKKLTEAENKIDMLQAEVLALKELVVTSTPSMPNRHLHPQILNGGKSNKETSSVFVPGHRRSTSHQAFSTQSPNTHQSPTSVNSEQSEQNLEMIDAAVMFELKLWRLQPTLAAESSAFMQRIYREDVLPCLSFHNVQLSEDVRTCIMNNSLTIEPTVEKCPDHSQCSLTKCDTACKFSLLLNDSQPWLPISALARNRVAAVCDLVSYMRYIMQGLVRANDEVVYWEIAKRRRQMALARLGFQQTC